MKSGLIYFFVVNLSLLFSFYFLSIKLRIESVSKKALFIFLLSASQIIATQLLLGVISLLMLPHLAVLNLSVSLVVTIIAFSGNIPLGSELSKDCRVFAAGIRSALSAENIFLIILFFFTCAWIIAASVLLPPRGVDDLTYHLPPVFEYIITHSVYLLPVDQVFCYAFPFNAEFLYMWPVVFLRDTSFIGITTLIITAFGIVAVYALGRAIELSSRMSLFIGLVFFFTPLALAQAGSAYIDNITTVFLLIGLYLAVEYFKKRSTRDFYLVAISFGILAGMKYTMLLFLLALFLFILAAFKVERLNKKIIFLLLVLLSGGYWYFRNAFILHNPLFPMNIFQRNLGMLHGANHSNLSLWQRCLEPLWTLGGLFFYDLGLGSLWGGFGLIFWAIALPCWFYSFFRSVISFKKNPVDFFIFVQFIIALLIILCLSDKDLPFSARLAFFVVPIALLALGQVLAWFEKEKYVYRAILGRICCLFSLFSVFMLSSLVLPSYRIDYPIRDIKEGKFFSKNRYLFTNYYAWGLLDWLTKDIDPGWVIYFASGGQHYTAPNYGSYLQNRIWHFYSGSGKKPDAFVFTLEADSQISYPAKKKITPQDVFLDPDYELLLGARNSFLFVRKAFLEDRDFLSRAIKYYETNFADEIKSSARFISCFDSNTPILATTPVSNGLIYYRLSGKISNPVWFILREWLPEFIRIKGLSKFYALGKQPVEGFNMTVVCMKEENGLKTAVYEYRRKEEDQ